RTPRDLYSFPTRRSSDLVTERVSVASDGSQANSSSFSPAISTNGQFIAFASNASNLASGDTNNVADLFVRDRATGTTTRVSVNSDRKSTRLNSSHVKISY